jgi:hypothetical protein
MCASLRVSCALSAAKTERSRRTNRSAHSLECGTNDARAWLVSATINSLIRFALAEEILSQSSNCCCVFCRVFVVVCRKFSDNQNLPLFRRNHKGSKFRFCRVRIRSVSEFRGNNMIGLVGLVWKTGVVRVAHSNLIQLARTRHKYGPGCVLGHGLPDRNKYK